MRGRVGRKGEFCSLKREVFMPRTAEPVEPSRRKYGHPRMTQKSSRMSRVFVNLSHEPCNVPLL